MRDHHHVLLEHLGVDGLHALAADVVDDGGQPVGVGGQLDDVGAGPADAHAAGLDELGGGGGEAALHVGGDAHLAAAAGGRVDDLDQPDRRHVELAWVVDDDGQQVVAQPEPGQRIDPGVAGEVGDHGDEATAPPDDGDAVEGGRQVGRAEALRRRRRGGGAEHGPHLVAAEPWRQHLEVRSRHEHGAEAVLVARREEADAGGGGQGDLRLVGGRRCRSASPPTSRRPATPRGRGRRSGRGRASPACGP